MTQGERIVRYLRLAEPVHLVGVGGTGMSALGEFLLDCGIHVTGCDRVSSSRVDGLRQKGMTVWLGHDAAHHLGSAGSLVYSAALGRDHPEIALARARSLSAVPRSVVLARLTRAVPGVCVAGSHGKSTVTALVAHVLASAGYDPGCIVGGVIRGARRGGFLGGGRLLVLETDEFDRTIERVLPFVGVITNVEPEHLDVYGTLERLRAAFTRFARRSHTGVVVWEGDVATRVVLPLAPSRVLRCGRDETAGVRCETTGSDGPWCRPVIRFPDGRRIAPALRLPGTHNAYNAAVAAAVAWRLGLSPDGIERGLASYPGLERRFEILGSIGHSMVITDYAHHPTEIRATLATAGAFAKPAIAVFQPHLYSRTAHLFGEFARSFADAAQVILTPVYGARERPIPGVASDTLAQAIHRSGTPATVAGSWDELRGMLDPLVGPPLMVVFLTAGDLDAFARQFFIDHGGACPASE